MSSQTNVICRVKQQADIMQNITDARLVPGRKQNTMGLETSLGEIVKYVVSDRTPQSMDKFYSPENRAQNNKQFSFQMDMNWTEFNRHHRKHYIFYSKYLIHK